MSAFSDVSDTLLDTYGTSLLFETVTIKGKFREAELARVQQYMNQDEWHLQPYIISLPSTALDSVAITNGMEITHVATGWKSVVRKVFVPYEFDEKAYVRILSVALPR